MQSSQPVRQPSWQQPAAPPQNPYAAAPPTLTPPTQDDYVIDPYAATQRAIQYAAATQFQPALQAISTNNRAMARSMGEMRHGDMFKKYGPEIDQLLLQVDPAQCTPDVVDRVVEIVKGRHVNELVDAAAAARLQQMIETGSVVRSGTATSATGATVRNGVSLSEAKLPPARKALLERLRVTDAQLDELLTKTDVIPRGITLDQAREEWFKLAEQGDLVTESGR